jgi:hypothetical protein
MKKATSITSIFIVLVMLLQEHCTSPTKTTGNGSDVENCAVAGMVYQPDGRSPAAGASVCLYRKLAAGAPNGAPAAFIDSVVTTTDSSGFYSVKSIQIGRFLLRAADNKNNIGLVDGIFITDTAKRTDVPACTLGMAGAIDGTITCPQNGDPSKVKVFTLETGLRTYSVDSAGRFTIADLPAGKYYLSFFRFVNYDTGYITVRPGQTTNLGTVALPIGGIPVPAISLITFDTAVGCAELIWGMIDTTFIKGYNVFRREADSIFGTLPLNGNVLVTQRANYDGVYVVTDMGYRYNDSTCVKGKSYEYKVVAIDGNDRAGTMSAGGVVQAGETYSVTDTVPFIPLDSTVRSLQINSRGEYIVLKEDMIYAYDANGNLVRTSGRLQHFIPSVNDSTLMPEQTVLDDSGNCYNFYRNSFMGSLGIIVKTNWSGALSAQSPNDFGVNTMCVFKDTVYVIDQNPPEMKVYNGRLEQLFSWTSAAGFGPSILGSEGAFYLIPIRMKCDSKGNLYIMDYFENCIKVYTGRGAILRSIPVPSNIGLLYDISDSLILFKTMPIMMVNPSAPVVTCLDHNGNCVFCYTQVFQGGLFLDPSRSGAVVVLTASGKRGVLKKL